MTQNNTITLVPSGPKAKRLKQLIKQHGPEWTLIRISDKCQCFDNRPGVFIESLDKKHTRWVEWNNIGIEFNND